MTDDEAHEFYEDPEHLRPAGPAQKRARSMKTTMVAVRFDPAVIAAVKRLTDGTSQTVSGWIRDAVQREEYRQRVKWLDEHRHELEVVPGSGRMGTPRAIPSSLARTATVAAGFGSTQPHTACAGSGLTFSCPHLSIGGVESAGCGICGPLSAVA